MSIDWTIIYFYSTKNDIKSLRLHWHRDGGVYICGYEKFCNLMKDNVKPFRFEGCDILICDEGHKLKNPDSIRNQVVNRITTQHRIILSGTPLQNNLTECRFIYVHNFTPIVYISTYIFFKF